MIEQTDKLAIEPEAKLILLCSRTEVDTDGLRSLLTESGQSLNWPGIFHMAGRNGLLPLVSTNLLKRCADVLNEEVRWGLSKFLRDHVGNNLLQTSKVVEIYKILNSAGIPMLPFKGPALAIQAYGDISLRQYVDLDMLVQPKHFDEAVVLLQKHGYVPIEKATWIKRKGRFFTRKKDLGLVSKDNKIRIELHWKLSGTHFAMPIEIDHLWQRLETMEVAGTELRSLPFNDLFVYLCLHGSRHGWEKFLWVCDINELIGQTEKSGVKINWLEVRQHARDLGCEKALELGVFLIEDFLGRRIDFPEIDRILDDKAFKAIAEKVRSNAFATDDRSMEMGEWYSYHLSLKEKLTDRLRIRLVYLIWYLKVAVKPNEIDEAVFNLPALFHPLYYLIRPIRLTLSKRPTKLG